MHAVKVLSPGPGNSVLAETSIFVTNAFPPQRSATGTHYRYGPPTPPYTILDPEGSVPELVTLVPAIGTCRACPTHAPSPRSEIELHCSSPRQHPIHHPPPGKTHTPRLYHEAVYARSLLTIYWRSRWSRGKCVQKGPCSFHLTESKVVADLTCDVYGR